VADSQTAAMSSCEICVSNIPATDTLDELAAMFESETVTGVTECRVDAVNYDSNDSTRAIVKFTDQRGSASDRNEYFLYFLYYYILLQ